MACVTGWFDTHRSLAVSLVSAGMGMAPMTMSPLAAWLITGHDWRATMGIIAALAAALMIPVALLVRRPPILAGEGEAPTSAAMDDVAMTTGHVRCARRSSSSSLLTNFFCCTTHSGPIIHTVSYAVTCGIPMIAAVTIYSVEGLAVRHGRPDRLQALGDRFGAKRVLVSGLLVQALGALGYVLAQNLAGFYAAASLFGFIYAGVMPLYAVIARENFPLRMMGMVIGGISHGRQPGHGDRTGGWRADL